MRLGYSIPNNQGVTDVAQLVELGVFAEQIGCSSVWVSEHLFHATYVEQRLGNRPYFEPMTVLTAIASATSQVRLGTSVLVLPWHHPVHLAKVIATLDHLSNGRVDLGVGVAVTKDEFANLGVDFHTRGKKTDDCLQAMRHLFDDEIPAHDGAYFRFQGLRFEPKPIQDPLPILIGGGSRAALRRVARFGHGWHALGKSPSEIRHDVSTLEGMLADVGRSLGDVRISVRSVVQFTDESWPKAPEDRRSLRGTDDELRAILAAYVAAGVHEVVIDANTADVMQSKECVQRMAELWPS